jgi:hypothetical protein
MMNARWPAIAFQSIFLGANSAFLFAAAGKVSSCTWLFIASMAVIMFLFAIQTVTKDPRRMYLFPVATFQSIQENRIIIKTVKTPAYDTYFLKGLLILSMYLFFVGASKSWIWPSVVVVIALAFRWVEKLFDKKNWEKIRQRIRDAGIDPDQEQEN